MIYTCFSCVICDKNVETLNSLLWLVKNKLNPSPVQFIYFEDQLIGPFLREKNPSAVFLRKKNNPSEKRRFVEKSSESLKGKIENHFHISMETNYQAISHSSPEEDKKKIGTRSASGKITKTSRNDVNKSSQISQKVSFQNKLQNWQTG